MDRQQKVRNVRREMSDLMCIEKKVHYLFHSFLIRFLSVLPVRRLDGKRERMD